MLRLLSAILLVLMFCVPAVAQTTTQPNVLFFYVEDLNYDLGTFGHPIVQTPNIDALAATGVRFSEAHCSYPVCGPSRLATWLGQRAHRTTLMQNVGYELDEAEFDGVPALPKLLRQNGYTTGGIGKLFHKAQIHPDTWDVYYDAWRDAGVAYPPHPAPAQQSQLIYGGPYLNGPTGALGRLEDTKYSDAAMGMIDLLPQPWFLAVGYVAPHTPYVYPEAFHSLYDPQVDVPPLPPEELTNWRAEVPSELYWQNVALDPAWGATEDARRRQASVHYWRTITYIDHKVGRVLAHLTASGQRDNTIIVFVSDHGFSLGEHGRYGKIDVYDRSIKAPLILSVPTEIASMGQLCDEPVEHVDIYPTLTHYCGVPTPAGLHGDSLAPQLAAPTTATDPVVAVCHRHWETRWMRMARNKRYKYIFNDNSGSAVLFDLQLDPGEYHNLAGDPAHAAVVAQLHQVLVDEDFYGAHAHSYQSATEGALGAPTIALDAPPRLGTTPNLLVSNVAGVPSAMILIAGSIGWRLPIFGGNLLLHPVSFDLHLLPVGGATIPIAIPADPVFLAESYCLQAAQLDPSLIDELVFTRGLRMFLLDT